MPATETVDPAKFDATAPVVDAPVEPVATAEPIKYEFKLPDGLTVDETRMGAYSDVLNKHKLPAEAAQEFLDMHTTAMQEFVQNTS